MTPGRTILYGAALMAALLVAGLVMPRWLQFLCTMAISHGVVSLGIVLLMRSGVVSFGQGFVFGAGGYAAALAANHLGISGKTVDAYKRRAQDKLGLQHRTDFVRFAVDAGLFEV